MTKVVSLDEVLPSVARSWSGRLLERMLGLSALNESYARVRKEDDGNFFRRCIDELGVAYEMDGDTDFKGLQKGPAIVVANHPFGGLEAIVLSHLLLTRRPDTKIMGNYLLMRFEEMHGCVIPVDPFGGDGSQRRNLAPMRESLQHLANGGVLLVFPAGTVSHWDFRSRAVTDPPWTDHLATLVSRTGAPVVPVHVHGRNGLAFQMAGVLHPRLRTLLLPRELMNKRGMKMRLTVGNALSERQLRRFSDRGRMVSFIRATTYLLRHSSEQDTTRVRHGTIRDAEMEPIADAIAPESVAAEVAALPESSCLVAQHGFEVYVVRREEAPTVVREIGRLREITFRELGEGSGKSRDLDAFDDSYEHLFLWSPATEEIAGAYRLARVDEATCDNGVAGLYTASLFRFKAGILERLQNAIELGRSFVVPRHQKQRYSLMMLWCGICAYIDRHPGYHTLFGPVSMSQEYTRVSRQLLVWFIRKSFRHPVLSKLVKAERPFADSSIFAGEKDTISHCMQSIDDVSALISEFESDGKGVPVLFRQYLRLNALLVSFSVDEDFSNVLDGLLVADLRTADQRILRRYFGEQAMQRFLKTHGLLEETGATGR